MAARLEVPNGNVVTRVNARADRLLAAEVVEKAAVQQRELLRHNLVHPGEHKYQEQVEERHCWTRAVVSTGLLILRAGLHKGTSPKRAK